MSYIQFDPKTDANPADIRAIECGAQSILLEESKISDELFDLSSGLLGELLHKLSIYGIRLGIVVSDPSKYSENFQSFLYEANKGSAVYSFSSRQSAIDWLEKTKD